MVEEPEENYIKGYIALFRSLQEHWIYPNRRKFTEFEAWIDLLLEVNHKPKKVNIRGKIIEVQRGESIRSLDNWALRWYWNKSKVRRFLKVLQKDSMLRYENETVTTRITICNYDSYQDLRNVSETLMKRRRNADETQANPNKNVKNVNNNIDPTPNMDQNPESNLHSKERSSFNSPYSSELASESSLTPGASRFKKPNRLSVRQFFVSRQLSTDEADRFYDYYESCGWVIGKSRKPMKNWKGAVNTWIQNKKRWEGEEPIRYTKPEGY